MLPLVTLSRQMSLESPRSMAFAVHARTQCFPWARLSDSKAIIDEATIAAELFRQRHLLMGR